MKMRERRDEKVSWGVVGREIERGKGKEGTEEVRCL